MRYDDVFTIGFVLRPENLLPQDPSPPTGALSSVSRRASDAPSVLGTLFPARGEDPLRLSPQQWAEQVRAKLEESVRLHLRSDVPVGAWLSPGNGSERSYGFDAATPRSFGTDLYVSL